MNITKKELEMYLKDYEWVEANATINNNMTQVQVTFGEKKIQKQDKMDLILEIMTEMRNDISKLKNDMIEVKDRLTTLETKVDNLEKDMAEVKTRLTNLESEAKNHGWNV